MLIKIALNLFFSAFFLYLNDIKIIDIKIITTNYVLVHKTRLVDIRWIS